MSAERLLLQKLLSSKSAMESLVQEITDGALLVYPTETIYGLGGRADSITIKERIYDAKNRPEDNPMILIAASQSSFEMFGVLFPLAAQKLIQAFWPGRLTLVLTMENSTETVAVRTSDHRFIASLFEYQKTPIFSTSANLSGISYNGNPDFLYDTFKDSIDFFIDGGILPSSAPSTVVRVTSSGEVTLLREGAVSQAELSAVAK